MSQGRGPVFNFEKRMYDASVIGTYMECPRKFYYTYVLGLTGKTEPPALTYGIYMHESIHTLYSTLDVEKAVSKWSDYPVKDDEKRTKEKGELTVREYEKRWIGKEPYDVLFMERDFKLEMPNGALYCGRIDQVVKEGNEIGPKDHKTASTLGGQFLDTFRPRFQFDGYKWATRELFGRCDWAIVNGILVSKSMNDPSKWFTKARIPTSDKEMNEFPRQFCEVVDEIERSIMDKRFRQSTNNCYSFYHTACPYIPACLHGEEIYDLKYKRRDWSNADS